jgi:hypothetical protein
MKTKNQQKYKSLKILPFPDIENAYVIISARESSKKGNRVYQNLTYLYNCGNGIAVEWEPEYGPLTVLYKCTKDHEDAKEHFFFDYVTGYGNWSQMDVDNTGIVEYLADGDYEMVFGILKGFGR